MGVSVLRARLVELSGQRMDLSRSHLHDVQIPLDRTVDDGHGEGFGFCTRRRRDADDEEKAENRQKAEEQRAGVHGYRHAMN